jgi:hypothetical protein
MVGALTLSDMSPDMMLHIACKRCDRRGQLRVSSLIDQHGADAALPDVARALQAGCEHDGQFGGCFVFFPELTA